jgi:hypothetical protein
MRFSKLVLLLCLLSVATEAQTIKKLLALTAPGDAPNPNLYRYDRYMQPILDVSKDADALDNSQVFTGPAAWDNGTEWRFLYTGTSANSIVYAPDGLTYQNVDQMFLVTKTKSNDVQTGWTKFPDVNGDPKPVFQPTFIAGRFDESQVWMRSIINEGDTLKGWYTGDDGTPTFVYKIGYAYSLDDGETWVKYATTPIYEDPLSSSRGIVVFMVTSDGAGGYIAAYTGINPNVDGIRIASSTNGIDWTLDETLFVGLEYGYPWNIQKYGSDYYLWLQKEFRTPSNYGPARKMFLLKSNGSDLTDWTSLGDQYSSNGSNEYGISGATILQKPNGEYFSLISVAKNKIEAIASSTDEPFTSIKVVELNRTDLPIANAFNTFSYPSYVQWHSPLGIDTGLTEVIGTTTGTINGNIAYAGLQYVDLNGSQTITYDGISINQSSFAFKMAVEIVTTGTHELFRIGNDILVTLESGKLRVRLSDDGAGYDKDYITTVNISKPTGLSYIDNHIYVGFTWIGGVLTLYNDFVPFTAGQVTETVDDALTNINNSQSDILIGQNATLEVRSPSILNGATAQQFIDLDI